MKRSKSSPGKGPSGRKSKSDSTSKPKRSFSKSAGAPKGRGGSKPFGRPRPEKAGSDKGSFRERSEGSGGRFNREEKGFDKGGEKIYKLHISKSLRKKQYKSDIPFNIYAKPGTKNSTRIRI